MIPFILIREQTKLNLGQKKIRIAIASLEWSGQPLRRAERKFLRDNKVSYFYRD